MSLRLSLGLGLGASGPLGSAEPPAYSAEALALFARFTTPPTDERKGLINAFLVALKSGPISGTNILAKADNIYFTAAADAQAAQRNWVADTFNLVEVNSPTFVADRGYSGDGVSQHLTWGGATFAGANYSRDSACLMEFENTAVATANSFAIGSIPAGTNQFVVGQSGANAVVKVNTTTSFSVAVATSVGLTSANRSGGSASQMYKDGASIGTSAAASATTGLTNAVAFLRNDTNYSARRVAFGAKFSSLTANEQLDVYNAVYSYLSALGATGGAPITPSGTVYAFNITGQSNAEGRGQSASSPSVSAGTAYLFNGGGYVNLADPVGGASTGSAWPAFANQWTTSSGGAQKAIFREQATGGTSVMTLETPNWSTTGTLLPAAVSAFNAMVTNLTAIPVTVAGGAWLWLEGETAARMIRDGGTNAAAYETALGASLQYAKDNCPGLNFIYISELGPAPDGTLTTAYAQVRTAQANVVAAKAFVKMAYTNAKTFTNPATMNADLLHYNQAGLNLVGAGMAVSAYANHH